MKDEFLRSQNALRVNIETLIEVWKKELKKDDQFCIIEKKLFEIEAP